MYAFIMRMQDMWVCYVYELGDWEKGKGHLGNGQKKGADNTF